MLNVEPRRLLCTWTYTANVTVAGASMSIYMYLGLTGVRLNRKAFNSRSAEQRTVTAGNRFIWRKRSLAEQLIIPVSCRTTGQYVCPRYHLCRRVSGLLPSGCVGKEAACDTCNRLHFVSGHTLLSGFTLSCTRNDLTFPTSVSVYLFWPLGFSRCCRRVRDSGLFSSSAIRLANYCWIMSADICKVVCNGSIENILKLCTHNARNVFILFKTLFNVFFDIVQPCDFMIYTL